MRHKLFHTQSPAFASVRRLAEVPEEVLSCPVCPQAGGFFSSDVRLRLRLRESAQDVRLRLRLRESAQEAKDLKDLKDLEKVTPSLSPSLEWLGPVAVTSPSESFGPLVLSELFILFKFIFWVELRHRCGQ